VIITIPKYPLRKTLTFPLHCPLSNNSLHCADVWYTAWLSLLITNLSLFVQCNKQTNKHKHSPFNTLLVTILFTLLIYETFHDFTYSVTLVSLPKYTKQTNTQTAVHNVVQTFHTRCPTVSYQCKFRFHLRLPLPFFSSINSNHIKYLP